MLENTDKSDRLWQAIVLVLQITVALQCLGNWRWLSRIGETPLVSWLLGPADVGGLGWSEATALITQNAIGWGVLVAGIIVLWRSFFSITLALCLLQILVATAMWRTDYGFTPQAIWLPPEVGALFPYFAQLTRISAPLGLLLVVSCRKDWQSHSTRVSLAMNLMRWAIAITFFAHGIEAWMHYPPFIDLLIGTAWNLFGAGLPQAGVEQLLTIIGVLDVIIAVICVTTRIRGVVWWMAFWGGITAFSRITALGFEPSWHQTLTRAPHVGVPVAVVLLWHLLRCESAKSDAQKSLTNEDE